MVPIIDLGNGEDEDHTKCIMWLGKYEDSLMFFLSDFMKIHPTAYQHLDSLIGVLQNLG